jgi:hypothetical protein
MAQHCTNRCHIPFKESVGLMGVQDILSEYGGCLGGQLIYRAAEASLELRHPLRTRRRLQKKTVARLQRLYPRVNLRGVTFVTSASLPANWFDSANETLAMTFGDQIWFAWKERRVEETDEGLRLLMHELVHVDQYRGLGSSKTAFACLYGAHYVEAGNYEDNQMEVEARQFVVDNPLPPARSGDDWLEPVLHTIMHN